MADDAGYRWAWRGIDHTLAPDLPARHRTNHPAPTVYHQFDDAAIERLAGV